MISAPARRLLRAIARASGVATSYLDYSGKLIAAKPEAMARLIDALHGKPLIGGDFAAGHLRKSMASLRAERDSAGLPAVLVAWDGVFPAVWLKIDGDVAVTLTPEGGEAATHVQTKGDQGAKGRVRIKWLEAVPFGYYTLRAGTHECMLISAPRQPKQADARSWGAFAPTYALRSATDQGIGGYAELGAAARFVRAQGGTFIGTLPLLPVFHEGEKPNPSPYSPISRLFWNEIFLDLGNLPGEVKPEGDLSDLFASCRAEPFVDYTEIYAVKKRVLGKAADAYFAAQPDGDDDYRAFAAESPLLGDYAAFRASRVPEGERDAAVRFHKYAQYACHRQLSALKADPALAELYLDYPVGVHPEGFDVQQFGSLFVDGYNVGAPPDLFFTAGQDWGFQALNPHRLVADRFQYFRAAIHHYFRYARMLRLDHVMGLFRLYCVPHGDGAHNGGYIRYPFDALLAILCLEAQRHDGVLIGEDLGTVPEAVEHGMTAHGLHRMWILYFQLNELPARSFDSIKADMIAGLNTHDMFPFAAFLKGSDIGELQRLGLMDEKHAKMMRRDREAMVRKWAKEPKPLVDGALQGMAASAARYVLVGMEDFWGETETQNVPGTVDQYPNWRKKFTVPIEEWDSRPDIWEGVAMLNEHRRSAAGESAA